MGAPAPPNGRAAVSCLQGKPRANHHSEQIIRVIRDPTIAPLIALTIIPTSGAPLVTRSATACFSSRDRVVPVRDSFVRDHLSGEISNERRRATIKFLSVHSGFA